MSRILKDALVLLLMLLPTLALGHEGHGMPGTLAHELNHSSWLVFAAVVVVAAVLSALSKDDDAY